MMSEISTLILIIIVVIITESARMIISMHREDNKRNKMFDGQHWYDKIHSSDDDEEDADGYHRISIGNSYYHCGICNVNFHTYNKKEFAQHTDICLQEYSDKTFRRPTKDG